MAKLSFGGIPPKSIIQAASRLRGSRDLEFEIGQFEALREEEKQKYGYGEVIDYSPTNVIPTAVDGLVRLVLGINEDKKVPLEAEELLTKVISSVFPRTRLIDIQEAFKSRNERSYIYKSSFEMHSQSIPFVDRPTFRNVHSHGFDFTKPLPRSITALQKDRHQSRPHLVQASQEPLVFTEDDDLDVSFTTEGKNIDVAGAGRSFLSPGWLTQLGRLWGGKSEVPVVSATPADIKDLLGGALFQALYKWMIDYGPVYLLPTGPVSSFLVISSPAAARHVLKASDNPRNNFYNKGLVAEVSRFLFGEGFAVAGGENWRVRRKAVNPAFHKKFLNEMINYVHVPTTQHLLQKLDTVAEKGTCINMEACFSQLTLDVVGKAVFNYDFESLKKDSELIQAVYTALKETEQRATDLFPLWKLPLSSWIIPRQRRASKSVRIIRRVTENLIQKCREMIDKECKTQTSLGDDLEQSGPSILRFLLASREEVSANQLRDDLLSMLVAGHETTGSALTWTLYLLVKNPDKMQKCQKEADGVLHNIEKFNFDHYTELKYTSRCVCESLRLYPHPPVLLRRAIREDELPGGIRVPRKQNILLSIYNIHHSPEVWDQPEAFTPERFPMDVEDQENASAISLL
eukprot:g2481.t1